MTLICLTSVRLAVELIVAFRRNRAPRFTCSRSAGSSTPHLARLGSSSFPLLSFALRQLIDERFDFHLTTVAGCEVPYFAELPARAAPNPQLELVKPLRPGHLQKIQNFHFDFDLAPNNFVTESVDFGKELPRNHYLPHLNWMKFSFKLAFHQLTTRPGSAHFDRL